MYNTKAALRTDSLQCAQGGFSDALGRWQDMLMNRCKLMKNSKPIVGKQSLVDVGVFSAKTAYCNIALELVLGDVFFNHVDSNLRSPLFGKMVDASADARKGNAF